MRIIYFDLDCTRRDHLGVYGYHRPTSPVIDELAKTSLVFDRCYVSDAPCLPSRAALFSCRPGIANGVVSHERPGCEFRFPSSQWTYYPEYTMPMRLLQQHDYHTVTLAVFQQRHSAWWFTSGFSEVINPTRPTNSERSDTINPRLLKWIRNNIHDHPNLFLHVNYMDAHTFYDPDPACRERVSQYPLTDWPDEDAIRDNYENFYGPKSARHIMIRCPPEYKSHRPDIEPDEISNLDDYKTMLDSYDGAIATQDRAIGEVIRLLKAEGVYEDTVIIISGDHGEAIGQMGQYFEHGVAADGVVRMPLIIHWPGLTDQGGWSDDMIYQYDFMATLVDLLGIERPNAWDAHSFASLLRGESFEERPYVVSGCGIFSLQRAVSTKDWSYVRTLHPGCSSLEDRYLFDMVSDPLQTQNVLDAHPEQVAHMEHLYADWWHGWCAGPDAVVDPMHAQIPTFEYFPVEQMIRRLEHIGRHDQVADLQRRLSPARRTLDRGPLTASRY